MVGREKDCLVMTAAVIAPDLTAGGVGRHERHMRLAIRAARHAAEIGGASIGAVVIDAEGALVSEGHSLVGPDCDPTSHAEMNAIRAATKKLGRFHLPECTLYSTLEPCSMCLGATAWAGLGEIVFGADGSVTPEHYYDQVGYSAIRACRNIRRDGDRRQLLIQGGVLLNETAALLGIRTRDERSCPASAAPHRGVELVRCSADPRREGRAAGSAQTAYPEFAFVTTASREGS